MSEILFTTIGGLRGAVSLILTQVVVTEQNPDPTLANRKVTAEVRPLPTYPLLSPQTSTVPPTTRRVTSHVVRCVLAYLACAVADLTLCHSLVGALQLALWTAGIVVCTLLINAPLMPLILRLTRLNETSPVKVRMRGKAARALLRYTGTAIEDLQHDEDEMLRGKLVTWRTSCSWILVKKSLSDRLLTMSLESGLECMQDTDGSAKRSCPCPACLVH